MTGVKKLERLLRQVRSEVEELKRPRSGVEYPSVERFHEVLTREEQDRFGELLERRHHHHAERTGGGPGADGGTNHGPGGPLAEKCDCAYCTVPGEPLTEEERAELLAFLIRVGALEPPEALQLSAEGS